MKDELVLVPFWCICTELLKQTCLRRHRSSWISSCLPDVREYTTDSLTKCDIKLSINLAIGSTLLGTRKIFTLRAFIVQKNTGWHLRWCQH